LDSLGNNGVLATTESVCLVGLVCVTSGVNRLGKVALESLYGSSQRNVLELRDKMMHTRGSLLDSLGNLGGSSGGSVRLVGSRHVD